MFPDSVQSKISSSSRNQVRNLLSNSQIHRKLKKFNQNSVYLPAQYIFSLLEKLIHFVETWNLKING